MIKKEEARVEAGSWEAPERFYIKITPDGPYLVYGNPPIDQEIIFPNENGSSWVYQRGTHFDSSKTPVALCRCGHSKNKPFCDGSHREAHDWDPQETASHRPLLEDAEKIEGPELLMADNEKYCAFARFCDAYGRVWNLVERARSEEEKEIVRHEVGHCPSGRLVLLDKEKQEIFEPPFDASIGIIEDPGIKVSGPIWVKGGIRIEGADGRSYEIRNRVTLCRCGQSSNKPFCDVTHASMHFCDGLPLEPKGSEW